MSELEKELRDLFDLRKSKIQEEKMLNNEVMEANKDVRLLTMMLSDDYPDLDVLLNNEESLHWDSHEKKILYFNKQSKQYIEAVEKQTIVRLRPFLRQFVKKAREKL